MSTGLTGNSCDMRWAVPRRCRSRSSFRTSIWQGSQRTYLSATALVGNADSVGEDPDLILWLQFLRTISSAVICGLHGVDTVDNFSCFVAVIDPGTCEVVFEGTVGCGEGTSICSEGAADEDSGIGKLFIGPPYTAAADTTAFPDDGFVVPETCLRTGCFLRRTGFASVFGMARTDL